MRGEKANTNFKDTKFVNSSLTSYRVRKESVAE